MTAFPPEAFAARTERSPLSFERISRWAEINPKWFVAVKSVSLRGCCRLDSTTKSQFQKLQISLHSCKFSRPLTYSLSSWLNLIEFNVSITVLGNEYRE